MSTREMEERRIVDDLAKLQRYKLLLNEHKGHWIEEDVWDLFQHAMGEMQELSEALRLGTADEARMECADVANYLAMVVDVINQKGMPHGQ